MIAVTKDASFIDPSVTSPHSPNQSRQSWLALGLLLAVTLFVYLPVRHHDFVSYDDTDYVTDNRHVLDGLALPGVKWAFTSSHACNWHPLTWLSHMLDVTLFGGNPAGHHLTSVLFHLANVALLFAVLRRLTGAVWRSLLVAALFSLHPLRVESVAWIAERKDVLSAFFFLLCLAGYTHYAAARERPHRRRTWYIATLLLFALGLMSKPMLVTLPCVLLLLDFWPLQRIDFSHTSNARKQIARLLLEKIPFFFLSAASCVITFVVQKQGGAVRSLESFSWDERLGNAVVACAGYVEKTFWPAGLAVFYPHPGQWPVATIAISTLLVCGATIAAFLFIKRAPAFTVGWLWFGGMLVPTIGFVQVGNQALADRYTYLPCIGLFIAIVWPLSILVARYRPARIAATAIAGAVMLALAFLTARQLPHWQDSERLYNRALAVTKNNYVAHNGLGYFYLSRGRVDDAIVELRQAIAIHPRFAEALTNFGCALLQKGRDADALACFNQAVKVQPSLAVARYNLGTLLHAKGRVEEAARELRIAATLRPDDAVTRVNLGNSLLVLGRLDEAAGSYRDALRIQPKDADALSNLGFVFIQAGRFEQAIACLTQAVKIQPNHANAHFNLGDAQRRSGRLTEARASMERALALQPNDAEAKALLETIHQELIRTGNPAAP